MPRHPTPRAITFLHPVFSPKGGIEGAMVEIDGHRGQLVFKPEPPLENAVAAMNEGDVFEARIAPVPDGHHGAPEHPVHELFELVGAPEGTDAHAAPDGSITTGRVVRLNYARHGEANGVVLDNGDFVHLRPDGQRRAGLRVGDRVEARGEFRALRFGTGRVIEASQVNGHDIAKPKPKPGPKPHDDKHGGPKKPRPPGAHAHPGR